MKQEPRSAGGATKPQTRYGFIGTSGLVIMLAAGCFSTFYSFLIVYKLMSGMRWEQAGPMFLILFLGGALPYFTGWMLFAWGKKVVVRK